LNKIKK